MGRGVRYKAAASPNIAMDGGRRTREARGATTWTEGPPSEARTFFYGGAGVWTGAGLFIGGVGARSGFFDSR